MSKKVWKAFLQPLKQGEHDNGAPCQDSVCLRESSDRIVAVLSDGVGSLQYSDIASKISAKVTADYLLKHKFYDTQRKSNIIPEVLDLCRTAIESECVTKGISKDSMDCTLLFAVLFKKKNCYITGQLGDGAICLIKQDSALKVETDISDKMYGANMTKTVLSSNAEESFTLHKAQLNGVVGILLTSDGLQNEIYSNIGDVKSNLQWYYNVVSMNTKEESINLISKRWNLLSSENAGEFSDDMSLVLIYQPKKEVVLPQDANWLCVCGCRNNLESTRCSACSKDFFKMYEGAPFKEYESIKHFFIHINENPKEELEMLKRLSKYSSPEVGCLQEYATDLNEEDFESEMMKSQSIKQGLSPKNKENKKMLCLNLKKILSERKSVQKCREKAKEWIKHIGIFLVAILIGVTLSSVSVKKEESKTVSKLQETIIFLESENTQLENNISEQNELLDRLKRDLVSVKNEMSFYNSDNHQFYKYDNGDFYIGKIENEKPNGFGILFSQNSVYAGTFFNGEKNGSFYVFSDKGIEFVDFETYYISD